MSFPAHELQREYTKWDSLYTRPAAELQPRMKKKVPEEPAGAEKHKRNAGCCFQGQRALQSYIPISLLDCRGHPAQKSM